MRSPRRRRLSAATLTVTGDIPTPLTLKAEDLAAMPREKGTVTEQDGTTVEYEGVPLREILKRAGAPLGNQLRGKALASYILAKAHDGYQVVFTLGEIDAAFGNEQILVADKRDGKPLFGYQGPFRLVMPGRQGGRALGAHAGNARSRAIAEIKDAAVSPSRTLHVSLTLATLAVAFGVPVKAADYQWNLPKGFPQPYVPADNPMTIGQSRAGPVSFLRHAHVGQRKIILRDLPQTGTCVHRRPRSQAWERPANRTRAAP